jgi:hypothetical protein
MLGIKFRPHRFRLLFAAICAITELVCYSSFAQENPTFTSSSSAVQYGYSIKLITEFRGRPDEWIAFRLGLSGGIGAYTGNNWFYPSLNLDLMFYHGGIGSSRPGISKGNFLDIEGVISYTITAGWNNRMRYSSDIRPGIRNYPLYYFNNWNHPSLQNPYNYSASWGGNYVFFLTHVPARSNQFVGFVNIHVDRFQVNYTNDGPPFFLPFGDKFDRLHTGGGFISFHGDDDWLINLVEVGYNKFTGFNQSSYELSNRLGNNYVFYRDEDQNYYNKSNWILTVANTTKNLGLTFGLYNYVFQDVQHRIHTRGFFPFHLVPYDGFISAGPVFYYQSSRIGLQ